MLVAADYHRDMFTEIVFVEADWTNEFYCEVLLDIDAMATLHKYYISRPNIT